MKWTGTKPLIIGTVDASGIHEEIIVEPGAEIPPRAMALITETKGDVLSVPYDKVYSPGRVKAMHRWKKKP